MAFSRKRKKQRVAAGKDNRKGCKGCNCKKTECLKLYCSCFAAETYCSGPCSCKGCSNKPQHRDKVLAKREHIKTRNLPKPGRRSAAVASGARHKRGCQCRKSMCQKKYCKCFAAGVECCDYCRCNGCKNGYGKKEDYNAALLLLAMAASNDHRNLGITDKSLPSSSVGSSGPVNTTSPLSIPDRTIIRAQSQEPLARARLGGIRNQHMQNPQWYQEEIIPTTASPGFLHPKLNIPQRPQQLVSQSNIGNHVAPQLSNSLINMVPNHGYQETEAESAATFDGATDCYASTANAAT